MTADTAVSEIRSALAAEGVEVEREPSNSLGRCHERLSGRHAPETVDIALKAAFARSRSEHGWQPGPDAGAEVLSLTKGNWTALAALPVQPPEGAEAVVVVSLICLDGGDASSSPGSPGQVATEPAPSSTA
ncbi:hypothetical protein [Streptomyces sp. JHA26]|uniref:hypothetical protein n=1 Tax=Streptomyces sp. JHA26 TaxID=1917143 RepID=UPI00209AB548|nr:hypothetical protein [Streptomyces sp. JHA26]